MFCSDVQEVLDLQVRQKQIVLNLHNAGILPEVIAMQLDIIKEEVVEIIADKSVQNEKKKTSNKQTSNKQTSNKQASEPSSSLGMFYLDAVVNIDNIIKSAQLEMWKSLKGEMEFNISTEDTQNVLAKVAGSKVTFDNIVHY